MKYNKILLISRWKTLGDSVVATVLAKELKRINPDCIVHAYVPYSVAELWRMSPDIDEVIVHSKEKGIKKQLAEVAAYVRFWRERYDLAVAVAKSPTVWMGFASLARKVTGNTMSRVGKLFFSDCVEKYQIRDLDTNIIRHYLYSLTRLGLPVDFEATPYIRAPQGVFDGVKEKLGLPDKYLAAGIAGSAYQSSSHRNFPPEKVAAMIDLMAKKSGKIYMLGSAGQRDYIDRHCAGCSTAVINLAGKLTLKEMAAFLQNCSLFVTIDSGPMHIADALGTPVIALFGYDPDHYQRCVPHGGNTVALRAERPSERGIDNEHISIEKLGQLINERLK